MKSLTKGFFTDMTKLKERDVRRKLDDISHKVRVVQVKKECVIRDFCEDKLGHYPKDACYYELTKTEKVQPYKNVMIMPKMTKKIYCGTLEEMRDIIGVGGTVGEKISLKPGKQGDWDVFVQSTSVNRKLVRGTRLLVLSR